MIESGTDGFGKTVLIQRCRDGLLFVDDVVMTETIQFVGRNPGLDMDFDHFQYIGGKAAGNAHFFDFFGSFDNDAHIFCATATRLSRRRLSVLMPDSTRGGELISSDFRCFHCCSQRFMV